MVKVPMSVVPGLEKRVKLKTPIRQVMLPAMMPSPPRRSLNQDIATARGRASRITDDQLLVRWALENVAPARVSDACAPFLSGRHCPRSRLRR